MQLIVAYRTPPKEGGGEKLGNTTTHARAHTRIEADLDKIDQIWTQIRLDDQNWMMKVLY